jgi:transposase, IS30 family
MSGYNQLSLSDRKKIEEALNESKSLRAIAALIGRNPSTISREVQANRSPRIGKVRKVACRDKNWCKRVSLCEKCYHEGAYCVGCSKKDCRDLCRSYTEQSRCDVLIRSPWCCNPCKKKRYGCARSNRFIYQADIADKIATERRSDSRRGINTTGLDMVFVENILKEALKRKLSPYEIATLYADMCHVSSSTLYRWIEAGVGDTCNLDLKRKVGFKPRRGERLKKSTRHTKKRNYEAFCALSEERQAGATEMDCVEGFRRNSNTLLTLYHRPSHLQIALLLSEHTSKWVLEALNYLKSICDKALFSKLFGTVLTD